MYISSLLEWPFFERKWDLLAGPLAAVRFHQGRLIGRTESLNGSGQQAFLETLCDDVVSSGEIEDERLDAGAVRASIARRLGIEGEAAAAAPHIEGLVEVTLDAARNHDQPLTSDRILGWHAALFGSNGKYHVEPASVRIEQELRRFVRWFQSDSETDPVMKAALAHLWFVTIHPFDHGNGHIARAIGDLALARSQSNSQRLFSMSAQIRRERSAYQNILAQTQRSTLDVTPWMEWFLGCLDRAIGSADAALSKLPLKAHVSPPAHAAQLNKRQRLVVEALLDGSEDKLTTSKYAKLAKCSQDTALRDIASLVKRGVVVRNAKGGRSTSYGLAESGTATTAQPTC